MLFRSIVRHDQFVPAERDCHVRVGRAVRLLPQRYDHLAARLDRPGAEPRLGHTAGQIGERALINKTDPVVDRPLEAGINLDTIQQARFGHDIHVNLIDAAAKHESGGVPESSATAENDFYLAGRTRLESAGCNVVPSKEQLILGVPFTNGPKVLLRPSFAMILAEVREKVSGCTLAGEASLIVDGRDITLEDVELSGSSALVIRSEEPHV